MLYFVVFVFAVDVSWAELSSRRRRRFDVDVAAESCERADDERRRHRLVALEGRLVVAQRLAKAARGGATASQGSSWWRND